VPILAELPDNDLLRQMQQGDQQAFEALFRRHYATVYRAVYHLVASREEAEDLAQETMLTLYRQPPRLGAPGDSLAAWLCRVALNRGYNVLRAAQRARQRAERLGQFAAASSDADDPSAAAVRAEERAHVRATLGQLPARQAHLLLLRYAGLSYAEIAAALAIAPGSVGTLLARAERAFATAHAEQPPAPLQLEERGTS
jgi:RNA polymerase sigma-70 factor (ECF subfamily)